MQDSFYESFLKNWDKFKTRLQGQIMTQAKKGVFTYTSLNLVLADCTGFWDSRHSEGGRWMDELEKEFPEKAASVKKILLKDMKFSEEADTGSKSNILQYAVPIGSAAVGFSLAKVLGTSSVVQAICTIAPAAIALPVTKGIVDAADEDKRKGAINSYLAQLEKYRISIENILLSDSCNPAER